MYPLGFPHYFFVTLITLAGVSPPPITEVLTDLLGVDAALRTRMPTMIDIPAGSFLMGSESGKSDEQPVHRVNIQAFRVSQTEITFAQWDACVAAGGCTHQPSDEGWGRGERPVINVNYDDITQEFMPWVNTISGANFRLPSEAEWEYVARAGTVTPFAWGEYLVCSQARYLDKHDHHCAKKSETAPVASYQPNAFGLYDMHGNVWEWTQDCWNNSYIGAPKDGGPWLSGNCNKRALRGGAWLDQANALRSAYRGGWGKSDERSNLIGFRLAQSHVIPSVQVGQTLEFLLAREGDPSEVKALAGEDYYLDSYYYRDSNTTYIVNTETGYICDAVMGKHTGNCSPLGEKNGIHE